MSQMNIGIVMKKTIAGLISTSDNTLGIAVRSGSKMKSNQSSKRFLSDKSSINAVERR